MSAGRGLNDPANLKEPIEGRNSRHEEDSSIYSDHGHSLLLAAPGAGKRDPLGSTCATTSAASRTGSGARSARRLSSAHRTLSGSDIEPDISALDLPARTGSSLAVAPTEPRAHGSHS